jgi:hypothetical protein
MAKTKLQFDVDTIFDVVVEHARLLKKVKWEPDELGLAVLKKAFTRCFTNDKTRLRKGRITFTGYVRDNGTVDYAAFETCVASAVLDQLNFHTGRSGGSIGGLISSSFRLRLVAGQWCDCDEDAAKWAAEVDTFLEVFVYLVKGTPSVGVDKWTKAITGIPAPEPLPRLSRALNPAPVVSV